MRHLTILVDMDDTIPRQTNSVISAIPMRASLSQAKSLRCSTKLRTTSPTSTPSISKAFLQSVPLLSCVRKTMSCTTITINSFTPISGFLCRPNAPSRKNCGCAPFWMRSVPAAVSPTSIWSRISPIRLWHGRCSTRLHSPALSTLHLTPASTNASIITVS